jgi:hypothetical protein
MEKKNYDISRWGNLKERKYLESQATTLLKMEQKGQDFVECIHIVQIRGMCLAPVNIIMNSRFQNVGRRSPPAKTFIASREGF